MFNLSNGFLIVFLLIRFYRASSVSKRTFFTLQCHRLSECTCRPNCITEETVSEELWASEFASADDPRSQFPMHYSAVNAVNAASPASASPSSSSLSPIGSSLVGNHSHQSHSHSHSHYHHLSGNDGNVSAMSHHSELMASLSDSGLSPVSVSQSAYNGVVSKSEPMCDDLATSTTTYTTLQSAGTAPVSTNTHNGHYAAQQSTVNQSGMAQSGNASSSSAPPPPQAKGVKRSAPSATATKSTYSNGGKANGTASANGTSTAAGAGGSGSAASSGRASTGGGKKTKGRVKIKMEFIDNKLRRYTTFSKRKTGIMKKVSHGDSFFSQFDTCASLARCRMLGKMYIYRNCWGLFSYIRTIWALTGGKLLAMVQLVTCHLPLRCVRFLAGWLFYWPTCRGDE